MNFNYKLAYLLAYTPFVYIDFIGHWIDKQFDLEERRLLSKVFNKDEF